MTSKQDKPRVPDMKYGVWVYVAGHQGWAKGGKNLCYADAVARADTLGRQDIAAVVKPMSDAKPLKVRTVLAFPGDPDLTLNSN